MGWSPVLFLAASFSACSAYNILVVFPFPAPSHVILGHGIVRPLLEAGHKVTLIVGLDKDLSHPNLTKIIPERNPLEGKKGINVKNVMDKKMDLSNVNTLGNLMHLVVSTILNDVNVQDFFKDTSQQFDVIIAEWMLTELYVSLQAVYKCPFIWFTSTEPHWLTLRLIDEPLNPAFHGDIDSAVNPPFSFYDRVYQLWRQISFILFSSSYFRGLQKEVYEEAIVPHIKNRHNAVPNYDELVYNSSLMFGNSHVSMGSPTKIPQSFKPIGGYHIDRNLKPLPADLQKLFDNAKNGVVYFSMGSNVKSKDLPEETIKGLLKVLGELKQTVIWKFETELPNTPKNVHIVNWAPQNSILAHPNTVLFITHGGLLSTTEAIHFGIPIVGIPVFGDQFINIKRAELKGFARKVDLSYDMEDDLRQEIKEVLSNPTYSRKAKEMSFVYHDRPVLPAQEVVHWTEHVIKTNGAPHLRSPALLVPWYQKLYLDLLGLIFVGFIIVMIVLKAIWRYIKSKFCKIQQKKKNQ